MPDDKVHKHAAKTAPPHSPPSFSLTFLVSLILCVLAGCSAGNSPSQTGAGSAVPTSKAGSAGSSAAKLGTIGVSLLTLENPFFKVIGDHITSEGAKHGYDTIVLSGDRDPAKQANQVKNFIVQKVAAIVLSPCDSKTVIPVIQEANAAGIPVFTVDIPCNEPGVKIACQIATDNFGGGKEAARAVIELVGESGGKVAIIHFKQAES